MGKKNYDLYAKTRIRIKYHNVLSFYLSFSCIKRRWMSDAVSDAVLGNYTSVHGCDVARLMQVYVTEASVACLLSVALVVLLRREKGRYRSKEGYRKG